MTKRTTRHYLKSRSGLFGLMTFFLLPTLALTASGDSVKGALAEKKVIPRLIEIGGGMNDSSNENTRLFSSDSGKLSYGESRKSVVPSSETDSEYEEDPTYAPLYFNDFESEDKWTAMTVVNANNDSETWEWYSGHEVRCNNIDNPDHEMDDWLITPLFRLEAGKKYKITYKVRNGMSKWPERYGLYIGNDTTVTAMRTTLKEPSLVEGVGWFEMSHDYSPSVTGEYALGFHGCSDKDTYNLHFDDIAVSEYIAGAAPSSVQDLTVTPDPNYDTRATITCKAPLNDLNGNPLRENVNIVFLRDSITLDTIRNVAPGATCTCVDTPQNPGVKKYSVSASNAQGESPFVTKEIFVGVDLPANVTSLAYEEIGNTGKVTATWTPVTTDINGNDIPENKITYSIYDVTSSSKRILLADGLRGTSHTLPVVEEGKQATVRLGIWAVTDYGESDLGMPSNFDFVGTPYDGYTESFANGYLSHDVLTSKMNGNPSVGLANDGRFADYRSADNDNGFIYMAFSAYNDASSISFGKVSLKSMEKPTLTFYTYNVIMEGTRDVNLLQVGVREVGTTAYTTVAEGTIDQLCQKIEGWGRVTVDLGAYKGKDIEFRIVGTAKSFTLLFLDDIRIEQLLNKDLKAHNIEVASKVAPGGAYTVDVTVANDGHSVASGYEVNLYCDGIKVATSRGKDLEPARRAVVSFPQAMPILAENKLAYHAEVVLEGDEKPENNRTKSVLVQPLVSRLPKAKSLTAEDTREGIVLNWGEPAYQDGIPETVTEDFETATPWALSFEDWTFVDMDDSPVGGIAGVPFPGIYINQTRVGYFVVDNVDLPSYFADRFAAHSGTQYIGALLRYDAKVSDDWAISPTLSGKKQTISFWAKAVLPNFNEIIDVLWSSGSLDPEEFTPTEVKDRSITAKWTQVTAEIPEGAKYFAIRSHSDGGMLLVDDVTFERVYNRNLKLTGYNVWRDSEKVNGEPVTESKFVDMAPGGTHTYRVTAVYAQGESAGSESVEVSTAGLDEITPESPVKIITGKGYVTISGMTGEQVCIYDISGVRVYDEVISEATTIQLVPGVYILRVGPATYKIRI